MYGDQARSHVNNAKSTPYGRSNNDSQPTGKRSNKKKQRNKEIKQSKKKEEEEEEEDARGEWTLCWDELYEHYFWFNERFGLLSSAHARVLTLMRPVV